MNKSNLVSKLLSLDDHAMQPRMALMTEQMSQTIPHTDRLRDELHRAGEHAKQMIDHIIGALSLALEDRANDQAEARARQSAPASSDEPLMTVEDLAGYLKIKPQTLRDWAKKGHIPYESLRSEIRFRRSVIDKWIDENRAAKFPTAQNGAVVKSDRSILRPQNHRSKSNGSV
jgi:excisionase family DNA binding protein